MAEEIVKIPDLPGGELTNIDPLDRMIAERANGTTGFFTGLTGSLGFHEFELDGASVETNASFDIDGTLTDIDFDVEIFDIGGFWDISAPARFTVPPGQDGIYQLQGQCDFSASNAGVRNLQFLKNGSAAVLLYREPNVNNSDASSVRLTAMVELVAGDFVTLQVSQTAGGTLTGGVVSPAQMTIELWRR